jgi:hypothetical protein
MFKEILYKEQLEIISILKLFSSSFYLAWWTAIALQLWHRKSIDFDLFSSKKINNSKIIEKLREKWYKISRILVDNKWEELTIIVFWVKITFLYYPFDIKTKNKFEWIKLPDIETLWAMKFYTLWRRWKWKDYVDIYTILNSWYKFDSISKTALNIFEWRYNEKLLREQLCYFEDIDYSEEVEFLWENIDSEKIKKYLCNIWIN